MKSDKDLGDATASLATMSDKDPQQHNATTIIDVPTGFNGTEKITFADVKPGDVLLDVFGGFTSPVKTVHTESTPSVSK